jgi:hypothetical protein
MRVEELLQEAINDQPPVDVASGWRQVQDRAGRRQRRWRVPLAAAAAAVVLAVCAVIVVRAPSHDPVRVATSSSARIPNGWQVVDFGDARIAVPPASPGWRVLREGTEASCGGGGNFDEGYLLIGNATLEPHNCGRTLTVVRMKELPASAPATPGLKVTINGVAAVRTIDNGSEVAYAVPELGVSLSGSGPQASAVLATFGPSARHVALAAGTFPKPPKDWQTVAFSGVRARVPAGWPTIQVAADQARPGCFGLPLFKSEQVLLGNGSDANCKRSFSGLVAHPPVDGLWIRPASGLGEGSASTRFAAGTLVPTSADRPEITLIVQTRSEPVAVTVGLGLDGAIARTILGSISVTNAPEVSPPPTTAPTATTPLSPNDSATWLLRVRNAIDCDNAPPPGVNVLKIATADPAPNTHLTIVMVACTAGAGTPGRTVLVYDQANPAHLAQTLWTDDTSHVTDGLTIQGAQITLSGATYSSNDVPRCCPNGRFQARWRWRDNTYSRTP